ncbi:MAG: AAA family ATPase [Nannocystis sp.]|nr:AAA family ATPase [Nannocystis sp.]
MILVEPLSAERCSVQVPEEAICSPVSHEEAEAIHLAPQRRAVDALTRGLAERAPGFNVAVVGRRGSGRTSTAVTLARAEAQRRPSPRDLVLLPNLRWPLEPLPAFLPTGRGPAFLRAMEELHARLEAVIHEILDGRVRGRLQVEIHREQSASERQVHEQLSQLAKAEGLALISSDDGFDFVPLDEDDEASEGDAPRSPGDSDADEERPNQQRYVAALERLRPHVEEMQRQLTLVESESAGRMLQRQREALRRELAECFGAIAVEALPSEEVRGFVAQLREHLVQLFQLESALSLPLVSVQIPRGMVIPTLLVTSAEGASAPIVQARNVSLAALFGRTAAGPNEARYPEPGTFLAGDLHRANGGFLIIDADALIKRERVYEHLKGCLLARAIQPHEESDEGNAMRIHPIALDLKLVLVADPELISQLQELDPEFGRLFKIRAEFADDMSLEEALRVYPGVTTWLARHRGLPLCDRSALRELIAYGARVADDQERMTTNVGQLSDLIAEAAATSAATETISAVEIHRALEVMQARHGQLRERLVHLYRTGALRVELTGAHIGQVNGLAVVSDGFQSVGRPCRVTAVTYAGSEGTLNIDREVEMSGPIHSKGVLILSGYLYDRFARTYPIAFGASVVFEQTYSPIDGDSASTAELFAILSSLAQVPARQDIGITGSVDQRGRILPVGAVNEKIEGFFDLCVASGLTGTQGVMIPHTNVRNLILREDVVAAIAAGRFFVWPIATVEEGVELLMGVPAGANLVAHDEVDHESRDADRFPSETVYGRIERRLRHLRGAQQGPSGRRPT